MVFPWLTSYASEVVCIIPMLLEKTTFGGVSLVEQRSPYPLPFLETQSKTPPQLPCNGVSHSINLTQYLPPQRSNPPLEQPRPQAWIEANRNREDSRNNKPDIERAPATWGFQ